MRTVDLKFAIEVVSEATEMMLKSRGSITPIYFIGTTDSDGMDALGVLPAPHPNRDICVQVIRDLLELMSAKYYVFASEAWVLESSEDIRNVIPSEHPDRVEVVMFTAEDNNRQVVAHREVIRGKGRPKLGPIQWITDKYEGGTAEGRLIGLMPTEGTEH